MCDGGRAASAARGSGESGLDAMYVKRVVYSRAASEQFVDWLATVVAAVYRPAIDQLPASSDASERWVLYATRDR